MKALASGALLVLLGAGCTTSLPFASEKDVVEISPEEIDLGSGSALLIEQTWLGVNPPDKDDYGKKTVTVDAWKANEGATLSWSMREYRETADSKVARENAMRNVGVGEEANIPSPVYEDVTVSGTILTDGLNNAERILLPSYWPEGEYDVRGEENSVLWLSRQQYDELVSTRSSHIQLGLFDSTLQDIVDFTDNAKSALDKLQGKIAASETTNKDFTKLEARADWGSKVILLNGMEVKVKTVEASNAFAQYTILANPENPLILSASLRPWALGPTMLTSLDELKAVVGYAITSITLETKKTP